MMITVLAPGWPLNATHQFGHPNGLTNVFTTCYTGLYISIHIYLSIVDPNFQWTNLQVLLWLFYALDGSRVCLLSAPNPPKPTMIWPQWLSRRRICWYQKLVVLQTFDQSDWRWKWSKQPAKQAAAQECLVQKPCNHVNFSNKNCQWQFVLIKYYILKAQDFFPGIPALIVSEWWKQRRMWTACWEIWEYKGSCIGQKLPFII